LTVGAPGYRNQSTARGGGDIVDSTAFVTIGSPAPDFRAPTSNGQTLDRASFVGKVPVALVFPAPGTPDLAAALTPFDDRMVEFGRRRLQVLAVVPESPRTVRELAELIPLHALPLLADPDDSIRTAYGATDAQCDLVDTDGRLRAVVPLGPDVVDEVLGHADALHERGTGGSDG
jgi:peroxiredoxin